MEPEGGERGVCSMYAHSLINFRRPSIVPNYFAAVKKQASVDLKSKRKKIINFVDGTNVPDLFQ